MVPHGMIFPSEKRIFPKEEITQSLTKNQVPYTTKPTHSTKKYLAGMVLSGLMMAAGLGLVVNQAIDSKSSYRYEMAATALLLTAGGAGYGYSTGRRSYLKNLPIK
jgi:hypothetical protein